MATTPTLKLVPDVLSEEDEQADLLFKIDRHLHTYPELKWIYHVPNGGSRSAFYYTGRDGKEHRVSPEGQRMKRMGLKPGVPDLCLPIARGTFHGLYIEMKKVNASPSDTSQAQLDWHEWLRAQGYACYVCKGCLEAWKCLMDYLAS